MMYYDSKGKLSGYRYEKLKIMSSGKGSFKLYDLSNDVSESKDIANSKPALVKKLTTQMEALDKELVENCRPNWKAEQ